LASFKFIFRRNKTDKKTDIYKRASSMVNKTRYMKDMNNY